MTKTMMMSAAIMLTLTATADAQSLTVIGDVVSGYDMYGNYVYGIVNNGIITLDTVPADTYDNNVVEITPQSSWHIDNGTTVPQYDYTIIQENSSQWGNN